MKKYKCDVCRDTLVIFVQFNCPFCVPKTPKRKVGEHIKKKGGADECPACKGNDKNSRLVMDATLGMDYECSDDWHISEGGTDVEVTKYKLFGLTVGTRRHISEGGADER